MNLHKIVLGISTLVYAFYIFSFPITFYNDDSLFLANGIINFSIIDFSPHFPGYVSLILMGKFINIFLNDAKLSLFYLTSICAILTPFVIYLYIKKVLDKRTALIAFLLCITSPYLNNFALSLLSDSVGFFFMFLSLYLIEEKKYKLSGIVLSISFFARPSYFIFFAVGLLYLYFFKKESLKTILTYFLLSSFLFLAYIFVTNGFLYILEGKRFILGHFSIWGTGQNSSYTWYNNIFNLNNIPFLFLIFSFYKYEKKLSLMYMFFIIYFIWIINYQNPENLRHLIPLVFIGNILISKSIKNHISIVLILLVFNIYTIYTYTNKLSPFTQITKYINKEKTVIITNHSIELLRESNYLVLDKYYKNTTNYVNNKKDILLISTFKDDIKNANIIKGRFIGERNLYYQYNASIKNN